MLESHWADTVTIDGIPLGVWDQVEGGGVGATETKYRPGGMARQVALGGTVTVDNLTLRRLMELTRDWETMRRLMTRCGKALAVVSRQPLDRDGNPFGRPLVYTGVLNNVNPPANNSEGDGAGLWEIVISTEGSVA